MIAEEHLVWPCPFKSGKICSELDKQLHCPLSQEKSAQS